MPARGHRKKQQFAYDLITSLPVREAFDLNPEPARVYIRDICATIYHCLDIDPDMPVYDQSGRPMPVAHGGRPLNYILA